MVLGGRPPGRVGHRQHDFFCFNPPPGQNSYSYTCHPEQTQVIEGYFIQIVPIILAGQSDSPKNKTGAVPIPG